MHGISACLTTCKWKAWQVAIVIKLPKQQCKYINQGKSHGAESLCFYRGKKSWKIWRCLQYDNSSPLSRYSIITTNGNAVGPPLPVYCESVFNWVPLFQPCHQSGAPRHAQLNEECAFEDVWLPSYNFWWETRWFTILFNLRFLSGGLFFALKKRVWFPVSR